MKESNLTELTPKNYNTARNKDFINLYQVQNIFKIGEEVNISLFNNQSPSKQQSLDGNKKIFSGGYKYYPYLWRLKDNIAQKYFVPEGIFIGEFFRTNNYSVARQWVRTFDTGWFGIGSGETLVELNFRNNYAFQNNFRTPFRIVLKFKLILESRRGNTYGPLYRQVVFNEGFFYDAAFREFIPGKYPNVRELSILSITAETAGTNTDYTFENEDRADESHLQVLDGKQWIQASFKMTNNSFYSGSVSTDPLVNLYNGDLPPIYPIDFNVMDLVRFNAKNNEQRDEVTSASDFKPQNEYTIIEVDKSIVPYKFKVDRPIDESLMDDSNKIHRYVFSKRVEDETNIVIEHKKNPGLTSGGIVKNTNLLLRVDDKLGNIVSGLKSKIFSTVLTS
jgi:hypothetical protein